MNASSDLQTRCLTLISKLSSTEQWGLSVEQQQQYAQEIVHHVDQNIEDEGLDKVIRYYYKDHDLVEALQQPQHPKYEATWNKWMEQVTRILRKNGLTWVNDNSIDFADLAQTARVELVRSIPSFHYNSRFSTWAYAVIVRSIQGYLRTLKASKRSQNNESLDRMDEPGIAIEDTKHPEPTANARVLADRINQILGALSDKRLLTIFLLWAQHDKKIEEIGVLLHLSPSRVRDLLKQARHELRSHDDLRDWLRSRDDDADGQ